MQANYTLSNVTDEQVGLFVRQRSIDKTIEEALRRILAQKNAINELNGQSRARESEMASVFDDQQRLRENMKALKGSAEEKALVQRYVQQLNEQENRLEVLRKERQQLDAQREKAQSALDQMIQELSFDVKL